LRGVRVQGQATLRDERVVKDALDVDRAGGDATYIRVARDVVHVVGRERPDHGRLQGGQPAGRAKVLEVRGRDEVGDPTRIDLLARLEVRGRRRSEAADQARQGPRHQG